MKTDAWVPAVGSLLLRLRRTLPICRHLYSGLCRQFRCWQIDYLTNYVLRDASLLLSCNQNEVFAGLYLVYPNYLQIMKFVLR